MTPVDTSGSRHYGGGTPLPPPPEAWICPACGIEQTGTMAQGCPGCGAGRPGYKAEGTSTPSTPSTVRTSTQSPPSPGGYRSGSNESAVSTAFRLWWDDHPPVRGGGYATLELRELCRRAFEEGFRAAMDEVIAATPSIPLPTAPPPLEGSAESRTILAALQLFLDQVLRSAPEEVAEGEWLSAEETEALIRKLKGEGS